MDSGVRRIIHLNISIVKNKPCVTTTWIIACAQTHLSKTSRIIKMQNAKGHAR